MRDEFSDTFFAPFDDDPNPEYVIITLGDWEWDQSGRRVDHPNARDWPDDFVCDLDGLGRVPTSMSTAYASESARRHPSQKTIAHLKKQGAGYMECIADKLGADPEQLTLLSLGAPGDPTTQGACQWLRQQERPGTAVFESFAKDEAMTDEQVRGFASMLFNAAFGHDR